MKMRMGKVTKMMRKMTGIVVNVKELVGNVKKIVRNVNGIVGNVKGDVGDAKKSVGNVNGIVGNVKGCVGNVQRTDLESKAKGLVRNAGDNMRKIFRLMVKRQNIMGIVMKCVEPLRTMKENTGMNAGILGCTQRMMG